MPASPAELAQLKLWLRAMQQLIEAIEARDKAAASAPEQDGAPPPRLTRIV